MDGAVVTFFDITRVVEGELLGTLVDELHHRVRNMLQVVSAVSTHTLRRAVSLEDFRETFSGRIRALARAHELVSLGGWSKVSLPDLIEKELQPYAVGPGRLVTEGPPVWLTPKAALSMGMILHEMATNGDYSAGTWLRSPHGSRHAPFSRIGCLIYVKTGHLAAPDPLRDGGLGGWTGVELGPERHQADHASIAGDKTNAPVP